MDEASKDFHHVPRRNFLLTSRFHSLLELQQVGQLCDVELVTSSERYIPAHRVVLAAGSPYFRAMFAGSLSESAQRHVLVVNFDSDIVEAVVKYCYNGDFTLPADMVKVLIVAADYYGIVSLYHECSHFLERNLNPSNCLTLKTLARLHGFSHLFEECTKFACDNFEAIIVCEEFVSLPCEDLKDLISRDEIEVTCEDKVYSAGFTTIWIQGRSLSFKLWPLSVSHWFLQCSFLMLWNGKTCWSKMIGAKSTSMKLPSISNLQRSGVS